MEQHNISVVICAYTEKRWDELRVAVDAVARQTLSPREIIVVVDHNDDLLMRVRANLPDVIAVANQEAQGLSGARNSGLTIARGAIVAFIDEDAIPTPTWLEQLQSGYRDGQVLGVGGSIEPIWLDEHPGWFPDEFHWVVGCTYRGMPQTLAPVRNLIGCNMSFRREIFEAIGGFRNGIGRIGTLPVGCEETELCIRAGQYHPQGVFYYDPQARVNHRVPGNRATWGYFCSRCYAEGLSKALVSQFVGAKDGLSSERTYALKTLPRGVIRGCADAFLQGDLAGLARAGAIVLGLILTGTGYLVGKISGGLAKHDKIAHKHNLTHLPPLT